MQGGMNSSRAIVAGNFSLVQYINNFACCQDFGWLYRYMWLVDGCVGRAG
jgi:hypothetical protein